MSQVPDLCTMVLSDCYVSQAAAKAHEAVGPYRRVSWRLLLVMAREKGALPYFPGYYYLLCSSCRSEDDGTWPKDASVGHPKLSYKGFPSESRWARALPPPDPSLGGLLS